MSWISIYLALNWKYAFWKNFVQNIKNFHFFTMTCGVHKKKKKTGVKTAASKWQTFKKCQKVLFCVENYKRYLKQFIWLIENIFRYKVDNIILLSSTFYMLPRNKMFIFCLETISLQLSHWDLKLASFLFIIIILSKKLKLAYYVLQNL